MEGILGKMGIMDEDDTSECDINMDMGTLRRIRTWDSNNKQQGNKRTEYLQSQIQQRGVLSKAEDKARQRAKGHI